MSTNRYSGTVDARITYVDAKSHYRVYIKTPTTKPVTIIVNEPKILTVAVDSPRAYDDAFKAAVALAGGDIPDMCNSDENGIVVSRTIHACGRELTKNDTVFSKKQQAEIAELEKTSPAFAMFRENQANAEGK